MKRKTYTLYLSCEEYGVILDALIRFKNKLTRQGRYTDIVDEVNPCPAGCQDEASLHLNIVYIRKAV